MIHSRDGHAKSPYRLYAFPGDEAYGLHFFDEPHPRRRAAQPNTLPGNTHMASR
jgi:hypothetical protein